MMWSEAYLINFFKEFLPPQSKLLFLKLPYKRPAIIAADLDGDGRKELVGAYNLDGQNNIIVLKNYSGKWRVLSNIKGKGFDINYLNALPITNSKVNNLIIGWQFGAVWAMLDILTWTEQGFKYAVTDLEYSKIEIEDISSKKGKDGKYEIVVWIHDTGEAYKIEVYRWENGKLVSAPDLYPYYFKKVVTFYKERVKEMPKASFYWYYLADAQIKAGEPKEALKSIDAAMKLQYQYPSKEELFRLREKALLMTRNRVSKLYPISIKALNGVKWGYIDNKGDVVIKPQYDYAQDFEGNGLAVVEVRGKSGVINESNNFIVEPKYETITGFSEGLAQVLDNGVFKVIDEKGKVLTPKGYSYIGSYNEGRAIFYDINSEGKLLYGYLDTRGQEVIPLKYESASDFKEGKAVVKIRDNQYAMIDLNGNILKIYNYDFVGDFGDGLLAFKENTAGDFGFINESGEVVIVPKYSGVQAFEEGRAVVNTSEDFKNKYGLIDKKGNFIIKPEYNDVNLLGEGMVAVGKAIDPEKPYIGSKYAIADINGKFLTEFIYISISDYKDGLASASDDKNTFFIDKTGNKVKSLPVLSGGGTVSMDEDLIKAYIDYRVSYLDKTGKVIWRQNTIISLSNKYKIIEEKFKPNINYLVYYPQVQGMDDKNIEKEVNKRLKGLSQVKDIGSDAKLDYNYTGDFLVEFFKKSLTVLELNDYQYYFGAAHGMPTKNYPHINLVSGRFYELKDLFKANSNYVKIISDIIGNQIKNDEKYSYLFPDAYKGITPNQPFYVDENNLYIYFVPYEIAPFAAGFPTFKIPFNQIMNIIDTQGEFWESFH